jgi:hypothetical protein
MNIESPMKIPEMSNVTSSTILSKYGHVFREPIGGQTTNILVAKDGTTIKRTAATIITTKATILQSPRDRIQKSLDFDFLQNSVKQHQKASLSSSDKIDPTAIRTDHAAHVSSLNQCLPLEPPRESYLILINESVSWFAKFLQKHITYFFDNQDLSFATITQRLEIDIIRTKIYPWIIETLKSNFLDHKTHKLITQLRDTIKQQFESNQINLF